MPLLLNLFIMGDLLGIGRIAAAAGDTYAKLQSVYATNEANREINRETNETNREISRQDREMAYKLGTETNQTQMSIARENNAASLASEREARNYNSVGSQKARALEAGVNPNLMLGSDASAQGVTMQTPNIEAPQFPQSIPMQPYTADYTIGNLGLGEALTQYIENELIIANKDKTVNDTHIASERLKMEIEQNIDKLKSSKLERDLKDRMIKQAESNLRIITSTEQDKINQEHWTTKRMEEESTRAHHDAIKSDYDAQMSKYELDMQKKLGPLRIKQMNAQISSLYAAAQRDTSQAGLFKSQKDAQDFENSPLMRAWKRQAASWDVETKKYAARTACKQFGIDYDPRYGVKVNGKNLSSKELDAYLEHSPVNFLLRFLGIESLKGLFAVVK